MPWREASPLDIKREVVLRALEPDANKSELAREHGISRKTLYKWLNRFRDGGLAGLEDRSRCPHERRVACSGEMVLQLLELRQEHPTWGPKKLRAVALRTASPKDVPSVRSIARMLKRAGMVRGRRRSSALVTTDRSAPQPVVKEPNDLWTFDFKGWWTTGDGTRCEPLTVRDAASRYLLAIDAFARPRQMDVRRVSERLFQLHGLPRAILVDNGSPFACTRARGGLSQLSAWWISLGITFHRSRPAHPQDNGGHERMHSDLAKEIESNPAPTLVEEQALLDEWRKTFNEVRPHESLGMRCPAEVYRSSPRRYQGSRRMVYPDHFQTRQVSANGCCHFEGHQIRISKALAGFKVGLLREANRIHIRFYDLNLGAIELPERAA